MTNQPLHLTAERAAGIAVTHLREMAEGRGEVLAPIRIVSVAAIEANRVDEVLPQEGAPLDTTRVVWVVRAQGTFVANHVAPGEAGPRTGTNGHFVIWDRDGTLDGWGFSGVAQRDPAIEAALACLVRAGLPVSAAAWSEELQAFLDRVPPDSPYRVCKALAPED